MLLSASHYDADDMMDRARVICHMYTCIDGKLLPRLGNNEDALFAGDEYDRMTFEMGEAYGCGSGTFAPENPESLERFKGKPVKREDVVIKDENPFYIAIDRHGKLRWNDNCNDYGGYKCRIIEALVEDVSDEFIAYLDSKNIAYFFAGKHEFDMELFLEKLKKLYGVNNFVLCGGAMINAEFMKKDLVDEICVVIAPGVNGTRNTITIVGTEDREGFPKFFKAKEAKIIDNNCVILRYTR